MTSNKNSYSSTTDTSTRKIPIPAAFQACKETISIHVQGSNGEGQDHQIVPLFHIQSMTVEGVGARAVGSETLVIRPGLKGVQTPDYRTAPRTPE